MPDKQTRQNTLPVATILRYHGESAVDLHFSIEGGQRNLTSLLSFIMSIRVYDNQSWNKEYADYFSILWSFYETKIDLGLEESLDSLEELQIKKFHKDLYKKESWIPNIKLIRTRFTMDAFSYYGKKGKTSKLPTIKERRRRSKYHHHNFIGVGYRDKGAARNVSRDGSPSWNEVAQEHNVTKSKASILRRNINLTIKEPTIKTVTLQEANSSFTQRKKVNFQKVYSGESFVGYKLKKEVFATMCGFLNQLDEEQTAIVSEVLKTRMSDGEVFFL